MVRTDSDMSKSRGSSRRIWSGKPPPATAVAKTIATGTVSASLARGAPRPGSSRVEWAEDELAQRRVLAAINVYEYFAIHLDRGVCTGGRWDDFIGAREGG